MSTTLAAPRPTMTSFRTAPQPRLKPHTPYGLTVAENCSSCAVSQNGFFCNLSERTTKALERINHVTSYPDGALIFMEGDMARGVHILCQGRAKLLTTNSDGKTLILKIAQPGEILGLNSVLAGRPYEITVETLQPCQLAYISREDFLTFIRDNGDACLQVAQHLGRDCHSAYDVIRSIGLSSSATEKLARFLMECAAAGRMTDGVVRVKLALTHEEIAQRIGCSRETVSRTLSGFKRQRLVELNGATLLVHNRAALENLAAS
jgi:CRP/FNR family transcriptional regulator, cyclic AMP receptor protein